MGELGAVDAGATSGAGVRDGIPASGSGRRGRALWVAVAGVLVMSLLVVLRPGGGPDLPSVADRAALLGTVGSPVGDWSPVTQSEWETGAIVTTAVSGEGAELKYLSAPGAPVVVATGTAGEQVSGVQTAWRRPFDATAVSATCDELLAWEATARQRLDATSSPPSTAAECERLMTDQPGIDQQPGGALPEMGIMGACSEHSGDRACYGVYRRINQETKSETLVAELLSQR